MAQHHGDNSASKDRRLRIVLRPFLLGAAVGGIAGAVVGTLLGGATRSLAIGLVKLLGRRLTDAEREELRFELLLQ